MSMLKKGHVRSTILSEWKRLRGAAVPERVSSETYDALEAMLLDHIRKQIKSHPTVGKTFHIPRSMALMEGVNHGKG